MGERMADLGAMLDAMQIDAIACNKRFREYAGQPTNNMPRPIAPDEAMRDALTDGEVALLKAIRRGLMTAQEIAVSVGFSDQWVRDRCRDLAGRGFIQMTRRFSSRTGATHAVYGLRAKGYVATKG